MLIVLDTWQSKKRKKCRGCGIRYGVGLIEMRPSLAGYCDNCCDKMEDGTFFKHKDYPDNFEENDKHTNGKFKTGT